MRIYYPERFDIIPGYVIRQVATQCGNDNCKFTVNNLETTLTRSAGWYDATGYFHLEDNNRRADLITCVVCHRQWFVRSTKTSVYECIETTNTNSFKQTVTKRLGHR